MAWWEIESAQGPSLSHVKTNSKPNPSQIKVRSKSDRKSNQDVVKTQLFAKSIRNRLGPTHSRRNADSTQTQRSDRKWLELPATSRRRNADATPTAVSKGALRTIAYRRRNASQRRRNADATPGVFLLNTALATVTMRTTQMEGLRQNWSDLARIRCFTVF